jgi:signal transduction histidine kinase
MTPNAKTRAMDSIVQARSELDRALAEIDTLRILDPSLVGHVAHALSNYNTVTVATVEMLQETLRAHPDPDVSIWLEGLRHAADLAQHTIGRLVSASAPRDFPLKPSYLNLVVLMERACQFYERRAKTVNIPITCAAAGLVPLAWADRVALAVIADNLLSNALRWSEPNSTIHVQILAEPGHVICSVCAAGSAQPDDADTALGLEVATELVRRMDGDLWSERVSDSRSCWAFRLGALELE